MRISVIIVNYNGFDLLTQCITSLQKYHTIEDYEIIIVDNMSTEGDVSEVVKNFQKTLLIKSKENLGFAKGNNLGLSYAQGEYVIYLNNDTIFIDSTLTKLADYMDSLRKKDVILGCKLLNPDLSHQECIADFDTPSNIFSEAFFLYRLFPHKKYFNKYYQNLLDIQEVTDVDIVKGAFMFLRKIDAQKLKGFDENFFFYSEEIDLCYRFKRMGGRVVYYPLTSLIHFGGGTTDNMLWFKFKHQTLSKIKFYQKHYSGINYLAIVFFHYTGVLLRVPIYFAVGLVCFKPILLKKSYFYLKQMFVFPTVK
ncbi:MAG: glycosyltransferase family 2 protein [Ignavibacteriaceae bacterium]